MRAHGTHKKKRRSAKHPQKKKRACTLVRKQQLRKGRHRPLRGRHDGEGKRPSTVSSTLRRRTQAPSERRLLHCSLQTQYGKNIDLLHRLLNKNMLHTSLPRSDWLGILVISKRDRLLVRQAQKRHHESASHLPHASSQKIGPDSRTWKRARNKRMTATISSTL